MDFRRIENLPPYVFSIINGLKIEARRAGADVVDLGFGNPDIPSPAIAVEKLAEAARNPRNHRYSLSRGLPKLREAIAGYYERKWGVELTFVRATAAGYMIELRYKVLDPGKAAPLFVRKTKPVLTHIETGLQLAVASPAKSGPLRSSDEPLPDHTYWMLFANPHRIVKAGDRVNLQIGDFAVEGLIVR